MSLSRKEVDHIAELAKLALSDDEKERFGEQLSAILGYADRLQELNTDDISPTASVLPVDTVLRTDAHRPGLSPKAATANSKDAEDDMFRVNKVFK